MVHDDHIAHALRALLNGDLTLEETAGRLRAVQQDLHIPGVAQLDLRREERTGIPEVIYADGKSAEHLLEIAERLARAGMRNTVVSHVSEAQWRALHAHQADAVLHTLSRTVVLCPAEPPAPRGHVAVVTGGTSDLAVAEEAQVLLDIAGSRSTLHPDLGIAGLHRVLDALPALREARVIICVAGMEAALPSVVAGLLSVPVVGVPASVGYGVNSGGFNALASILGSCVPGVAAVNIDNGIGAAALAHRINLTGIEHHD